MMDGTKIGKDKNETSSTDEAYMKNALQVAEAALNVGEVPVGCVIVLRNHPSIPDEESVIISHGANQVNATRDATRHAEMVAIDRLLTLGISSDQLRLPPDVGTKATPGGSHVPNSVRKAREKQWEDRWINVPDQPAHWKNSFGWRNNSLEDLKSKKIFGYCDLYVTCEPCIMVRFRVNVCCDLVLLRHAYFSPVCCSLGNNRNQTSDFRLSK